MLSANEPTPLPPVALWRINALRILFALIAVMMGHIIWGQLLFHEGVWPVPTGVAKSMLGGLALLSLFAIRAPLQLLPLMLFEMTWKTVWLFFIALRAWLEGGWTADMESTFYEVIGIVVAFVIMPWPYVWARFIAGPADPWRRP